MKDTVVRDGFTRGINQDIEDVLCNQRHGHRGELGSGGVRRVSAAVRPEERGGAAAAPAEDVDGGDEQGAVCQHGHAIRLPRHPGTLRQPQVRIPA